MRGTTMKNKESFFNSGHTHFCFLHYAVAGPEAHLTTYSKGSRDFSPGVKLSNS